MSKLILVSFADNRFRNSLVKLREYTDKFPFDERYFLSQDNALTPAYWRKLKPWLYRRGYGYWAWKAAVVKDYMNRLNDGDLLFWSDAGIFWNYNEESIKRFNEYIHMLDGDGELLTFQQPTPEQEYTKGDVLSALGVYDNEEICQSNQLWAGCFLMKKTPEMMKLLDKWIELNDLSKELITDKKSIKPNKIGFKEHRHDQSIFSLLAKLSHHVEISYMEVLAVDDNWESMMCYPIQGKRMKEHDRPLSEVLKNKLLRPWRILLNFYFRKIREYEFAIGSYPW